MSIDVESKVNIYRKNGQETKGYTEKLIVESDGIWSDRVVIVYGDLRLTVVARDLQAAIANAINVGSR